MTNKDRTCNACKHWGGQGCLHLVKTTEGDYRVCMADMFGDYDNPDAKPMFRWVVSYGDAGNSKGSVHTHKDFGCVNFNASFEKVNEEVKG